ncbi:uncharacterized protein LOC110876328 [Helianthus annuus]|uniref:uncharacterized protein LOC110876328 n=1 Tax=Helianthus annuus TaxID=4232 RepID=UPI000B8EF888|nr:uncharacterized protein LOC110876328 [Helianthus annuus]
MNILSINIRGVTGSGKSDWVRKLKKDWRFSFLGIQETHQAGLPDQFWNSFWDRSPMEVVTVDAVGRSGGMACLWDPGVFSVDNVVKNQNFILITGRVKGVDIVLNLLCVYAPNDPGRRRLLWANLINLKPHFSGVWVAFGDFNDVRYKEERVNSIFDSLAASAFNDFIHTMGWLEYPLSGGNFTCISGHRDVKLSKLDRFLVCDDFMNKWPLAKVNVLPKGLSDHCPIFLSCINSDYGPPPFKFYNSWLDVQEVNRVITRAVGEISTIENGVVALANVLRLIKSKLKEWKERSRVIEEKDAIVLRKTLADLEKMAEVARLSEEEKKIRLNFTSKLKEMEVKKNQRLAAKGSDQMVEIWRRQFIFFSSRG